MKLTTERGELPLPDDFSFTMENTNMLFSDAGDCTIPATIPINAATEKVLQHPDRLNAKDYPLDELPAIMQGNGINKKGTLLIDSYNKDEGVTVSFIDTNSCIYNKYKNKTLAQLFDDETIGLRTFLDFGTTRAAYEYINDIYLGNRTDTPFCVFEVYVDKKDDDGTTTYKTINAPDYTAERTANELFPLKYHHDVPGYPDGYWMTPFFVLHKFLSLIFEQMGYSVVSNTFATHPILKRIAMVNNCVDSIVRDGLLKYSDLCPDMSVADFFTWMKNKFLACFAVNENRKTIEIYILDELLKAKGDLDITPFLDGNIKLQYESKKQVVISSNNNLEEEKKDDIKSVQDIIDIYSGFEKGFNLEPLPDQCIYLNTADNYFYDMQYNMHTTQTLPAKLCSANFEFNEKRDCEEEKFDCNDVEIVNIHEQLEIIGGEVINCTTPYIGDHINRNMLVVADCKKGEQDLMICYFDFYLLRPQDHTKLQKYGSTLPQQNLETHAIEPACGITNADFYKTFFHQYNRILLKGATNISGIFRLPIKTLNRYNIYKQKYLNGKRLIPKSLSYEIGKNIDFNESEFLLNDPIDDFETTINKSPQFTRLIWSAEPDLREASQDVIFAQIIKPEDKEEPGGDHGVKVLFIEPLYIQRIPEIILPNEYLTAPMYEGQLLKKYAIVYNIRWSQKYGYIPEIGQEPEVWYDRVEDVDTDVEYSVIAKRRDGA